MMVGVVVGAADGLAVLGMVVGSPVTSPLHIRVRQLIVPYAAAPSAPPQSQKKT